MARDAKARFFQALVRHVLLQRSALEMRAICLYGGHRPLADHKRPEVTWFNDAVRFARAFAGTEIDCAPEPPGGGPRP